MSSNEVIRMAYELMPDLMPSTPEGLAMFADIVAAAEREKVAKWMIKHDYATGHGDTIEDLLKELVWQAMEREREACAKVCEKKTAYQMQIPCPDGISGCLVLHTIEAKREKTGSECAAAIRKRGNT